MRGVAETHASYHTAEQGLKTSHFAKQVKWLQITPRIARVAGGDDDTVSGASPPDQPGSATGPLEVLHLRRTLTLLAIAVLPLLASPAASQSGTPAPPFAVRDLDGRTIRLSDLRGKPVVLDFWATWCAPCRVSMPELDQLQQKYADQGLVVLGLSLDEDNAHEKVRRFVDKLGVKFRIALANEKMLAQYGPIRSAPTTLFINRNCVLVRRVVGYVDRETMETFIRELF